MCSLRGAAERFEPASVAASAEDCRQQRSSSSQPTIPTHCVSASVKQKQKQKQTRGCQKQQRNEKSGVFFSVEVWRKRYLQERLCGRDWRQRKSRHILLLLLLRLLHLHLLWCSRRRLLLRLLLLR